MSKCVLTVPSSQHSKDWFAFVNDSLAKVDAYDDLIIDFNGVRFLETDDFVILACLIESFYHPDCKVNIVGGTEKFNAHLENIRFKEYWDKDFNREEFTVSRNRSTLCLWKISRTMISSYSHYANKYFRDTFIKGKDLLPLASNLEEVFNNIFDHSGSDIGYIITQYFPHKKKLSFSVCDFGMGIPNSINNYKRKIGEKTIEDWDALRLALENGFSIKSSPQNRGMGLDNIREFTESSNGTLTILSNNGGLIKSSGEFYKLGYTGYDFSGTLIKVEVDTETFDMLEDEDMVFDF